MKNYVLILLVGGLVFLGSVVYKYKTSSLFDHFPVELLRKEGDDPQIYLVLFFSSRNCLPCLEIILTLNQLPEKYKVIGLVPEEDLQFEEELREITRAKFELRSLKKFKKYIPNYAPTLIGLNQAGEIFFVLPGVPGENAYLREFLESFLHRAKPLLVKEEALP